MTLEWVGRNRLQQTGGAILGWADSGITPEEGVSYRVQIIDRDTSAIKYSEIGITAPHTVQAVALDGMTHAAIYIWSVRDGADCLYPFYHEFDYSSGENTMAFVYGYTPPDGDSILLHFEE